jgi:hypothetical protein
MAELVRLENTNRHPVDELADLRETMKRLKVREDELREMIISKKCSRQGDEHTAFVETKRSERLDKKQVVQEFGRERLRHFLTATEAVYVTVKRNG